MPAIEEYLTVEYKRLSSQLSDIDLYVRQCVNLLNRACKEHKDKNKEITYWPYTYPNSDGIPDSVSVSTQGMCAAAVDLLVGAEHCNRTVLDELAAKQRAVLNTTLAQIQNDFGNPTLKRGWKSGTFGEEDVFTASWLIEVMRKRKVPEAAVQIAVNVVTRTAKSAISNRFEKSLFQLSNDAGPHPLPLLRLLQAVGGIEDSTVLKAAGSASPILKAEDLRLAAHWFERNLHRQMSFFESSDFRFDAAEIVFCLAGLLQTGETTAYDDVIKQVLNIVREAQKRSVYWRPYRPMISTETGFALLPLSIEVATTLLDILRKTGTFEEYQDTLETYYKWLVSQRIVEDHHRAGDPNCWAGWHSENAYDMTKIHVWDTARVATFMLQYGTAIRAQVQKDLRNKSGFTIKHPDESSLELKAFVPYDEGSENSQVRRISTATEEDSFSLLLYGPPGVSKTTIAQAIAKQKQWDLVYITPSDFISGGESAIEQKAKLIFDTLSKMTEAVVFFDEIDRLLLDRDSKGYGKQGDIFQFMTPSMLAKLTELRKVKKLGFIIATNYADRIDRAIKREGRIDKALLCLPPNKAARKRLIKDFLGKRTSGIVWKPRHENALDLIASRTSCFVYEELKSFVNRSLSSASDLNTALQQTAAGPFKKPELSVSSYDTRLKDEEYTQKPWEELFGLRILMTEIERTKQNKLATELGQALNEHSLHREDILSLATSCGLDRVASILKRDAQG